MAEIAARADVPEHLRDRVDKMFKRDARAAITLIVVLWLTIFFVILAVRPYMPPGVEIGLLDRGGIPAPLQHGLDRRPCSGTTRRTRQHIYPIDIHHLDAGR